MVIVARDDEGMVVGDAIVVDVAHLSVGPL